MTQEYFLGLDVPPDAHRFYQSVTAWARRVHGIHSGVNATAHIMVKLPFADDELALSSQSELRAWLSSVIMAWRRGPVGVALGPVITVAPEEICLDARGNDLRALMRHIQWRSWLRNLRVRPGLPQPRLVLFTGLEEEFFPAALELVSARGWRTQAFILDTLQLFRKGDDGRWWVCDDFSLKHTGGRSWW